MTYKNFNFILLAAGKSTRFGRKINKVKINFRNNSLIENALISLEKYGFKNTVVVYNKDDQKYFQKYNKKILLIEGGAERSDSVRNALKSIKIKKKYTIIHDLARPLINENTLFKISKYLSDGFECVVPYNKVIDTVIIDNKSLNRDKLKLIKTPQGFLTKTIMELHNKNSKGSDDSELFRKIPMLRKKIKYFKEKDENFKLTYPNDIKKLKYFEFNDIKFGIGYDIHRLEKKNKLTYLMMGGVKLKSFYKIISHSDGDVILHSITDSILGSISKRDIGVYFPNNKYNKNKNSMKFLLFALNKLKKLNFFIGNIDIMVVSEKPKININYKKILLNLCEILQIEKNQITIKATTNEKSGLIGSEKFIAVWSSILIKKIK